MKHIIPLILTLSLLGCQPSPPLPAGAPFGDDKGLEVGETSTAANSPVPTAAPDPNEALAAQAMEQITADISQQPYLQALEEITDGAISQTCVDFAIRLGSFEENLSANHAQYTFSVSADGVCYVTTADGTVIVDAWNNDGPLYLTPANASQALGVAVTRVSADGRHGLIGDAYDAEGRRVGGVSRFLLQWEAVNADGVLPSEADPSSVPPTPVNPEQSNLYQVNYSSAIDAEAQAQAMQALVRDYMSGKLKDLGGLNAEQLRTFRAAYVEAKNEARTPELVTYTYINGEEFFINPQTFKGEKLPANPSADFIKENTITTYYEVDEDANGNLMVKDLEGNWHTIAGSAGIKWNKIITDYTDPDMPKVNTKTLREEAGEETFNQYPPDLKKFGDLTYPEQILTSKEIDHRHSIFMPVIMLKPNIGEVILKAGNAFRKEPTLQFLAIEYDDNGNALAGRKITVIGLHKLYKEDDSMDIGSGGGIKEYSDLFKALQENAVYYIGFPINQQASYEQNIFASIDNMTGVVPTKQNTNVISGKSNSDKQLLLIVKVAIEASSQ